MMQLLTMPTPRVSLLGSVIMEGYKRPKSLAPAIVLSDTPLPIWLLTDLRPVRFAASRT